MVSRGNSLFGYGWAFHRDLEIKKAYVEVCVQSENTTYQLPATIGGFRKDVAKIYPNNYRALYSGFVVYGGWKGKKLNSAKLICIGENGQTYSAKIAVKSLDSSPLLGKSVNSRFLLYKILFRRFWSLLQQGNLKALSEKVSRYLKKAPSNVNNVLERIVSIWQEQQCPKTMLLIDHDLGGGANTYRAKVIEKELEKGNMVILYTYHVLLLEHVVEVYVKDKKDRFSVNIASIIQLPNHINFSEIFYNTGVSFERPEDLPVFMSTLSESHQIPITLTVNDYFMICPSQFLLNNDGKYCDIPSLEECKRCLPQNSQGFISLFEQKDIVLWRKRWKRVIEQAQRIICFSNSSARLLQKAYPELEIKDKIYIKPHDVSPVTKAPNIKLDRELHIGIVGHINVHKGALVIKELSEYIAQKGLPIKITVFGTIEAACHPKVVHVLGSYKLEELSSLIESSGANVFFMPSICPETFSFVVHELINMDLPLVCFNLGAQAERVGNYKKGLILPVDITTPDIIECLNNFYQSMRNQYLKEKYE